MATTFAQINASKIIDVVDDFVTLPQDQKGVELRSRLENLIDDLVMEAASKKLLPEQAYSTRIASMKQKIADKVNEATA